MTYSSADIEHKLGLKQGGLILIALLSGGDYHDGVRGCGPAVGLGLAKCGFGDSLLDAARTLGERDLNTFLHGWRQEICLELRTNPRKLLPTKKVALANNFPADFPDLRILDMYVNPRTSETVGKTAADMRLNWDKEPDIGLIAGLCEQYFEWGYREMIIKRFRTIIWPYAVLRIIRRAAILADRKQARSSDTILPSTPRKKGRERTFSVGTPSKMIKHHFSTSSQASRAYDSDSDSDDSDEQLISKIHLSRRHVETDKILEYRLEIAPKQLVRLADAGIEGRRQPLDMTGLSDWEGDEDDEEEEEGRKKSKSKTTKPPPPPDSRLRLWLPASMVAIVEPELVADFKEKEAKKESKKAGKTSSSAGTSKAKASGTTAAKTSKAKTAKTKIAAIPEEDCDEEHVPRESAAKVTITVLQQEPAPSKEKTVASTSKNFAAGRDADPKAMDQFFKTSKGIRNAKKSSSIAKVAGLFASDEEITFFKDLTGKGTDRPSLPDHSNIGHSLPAKTTSSLRTRSLAPPSSHPSSSKASSSRIVATQPPSLSNLSRSKTIPSQPPPPRVTLGTLSNGHRQRTTTPPTAPRPFPLDLEEFKLDTPLPTASASTSHTQRRLRAPASPDSEDRVHALQKSPRKSVEHDSPRSKQAALYQRGNVPAESDADDDWDMGRPASPSPMRPRRQEMQPKKVEYIDISSDPDTPPKPIRSKEVPPLQAARTRMIPTSSTTARLCTTTKRPAISPDDIIEISD